jgi:ABC-type transport system substrate-binding protein
VKPLDDPRVTKALRLLVDHDEAVKLIGDFNGRGYMVTAFPSTLIDWDLTEEEKRRFVEFKSNKDEATRESVALLGAAGFSAGNPLKISIDTSTSNTTGTRIGAEALQAQFRRFSQGVVQPELKVVDTAVYFSGLERGGFEYAISDLVAPMPFDSDSWLRTFYHSTGSRNYGKYSDPALDQMIDRQRTIFDEPQRKAAVKEVLRYLLDKAPYTSWAGFYGLNAWQSFVKGWSPEANSAIWGYQYEQVWLDT